MLCASKKMAVILTSSEGFVLDHKRALISAYSRCYLSTAVSSSLPQHITKDVSNLCSGNTAQCLGSVTTSSQQCSTQSHNYGDSSSECGTSPQSHGVTAVNEQSHNGDSSSECEATPLRHGTTAVNDDTAAAVVSCDPASEHTVSVSGHSVQGGANTKSSKQPLFFPAVKPSVPDAGTVQTLASVSSDTVTSCIKSTDGDCLRSARPCGPKLMTLSLSLRQGFFALKVPFMVDSQFESVSRHFSQESTSEGDARKQIGVADIHQVLRAKLSKQRKRKRGKNTGSMEEEMVQRVHASLVGSARKESGMFQQHVTLPLDNNLLSRQCAELDRFPDVFSSLLTTDEGASLLHMGDCLEPLVISGSDSATFSAIEIIHRRVSHPSTEASVVDIDGTSYVLPPRSEFLVSNLQDFCDHLCQELDESGYDLVVLDPPWENKSVKRKKTYSMVGEDSLQSLPLSNLTRPGSLVGVWVTNNQRLQDYCLHTLFPLWSLTLVARWYWVKVTQTGDMISDMDGHKKPYEILLLGRRGVQGDGDGGGGGRRDPPGTRVMVSIPCSLHSKKPPLADVIQPYLPARPRCLELFARNLWPGWTSWGREALKHQNLMFYEVLEDEH